MKWVFKIALEDIRGEYKEGKGVSPCICCGKEVKNPKYYVHLLTSGDLVSSDEEFEDSQGLFPIGNSCKSKLPNNFYFKS